MKKGDWKILVFDKTRSQISSRYPSAMWPDVPTLTSKQTFVTVTNVKIIISITIDI